MYSLPKLLCSTGTFSSFPDYTSYQAVLRYGPQLDIEGFELMFYPAWYDELERATEALQQSGLSFPALHTEKSIGATLGNPLREERERALHKLEANCQLGNWLGTKVLILHLWGLPESDEDLSNNLNTFKACLDITDHYGLELAVETIPCRKADPLSNVCQAVDHDGRSRVALDTEFLAQHEQLAAVFESDWLWQNERIRHIHIKDFDGEAFSPDGRRRYLHPGEGYIDFSGFFTQLRQRSYNGHVSLESSAIDQLGNVDIAKIQRSLDFVRQALH